MQDVIVIGAGCAGLSAAVYLARYGAQVLVVENAFYGGQIVNTPDVENYPGIEKISGYDFAQKLYEQAVHLGAKVAFESIQSVDFNGKHKTVTTSKNTYQARAVIIANGAQNRKLGVPGEQELAGKGVSYCATCDGNFYKNKTVAVVGGGNTALEDAQFLANLAGKVYLIHRRDQFRADNKNVQKVLANPKIEVLYNSEVTRLLGQEKLEQICVCNKALGQEQAINVDGIFVAIGQMPQNQMFAPFVQLDSSGYIVAGEDCKTSCPGVFAAGDTRTKALRQLVTAASDGANAAFGAVQEL